MNSHIERPRRHCPGSGPLRFGHRCGCNRAECGIPDSGILFDNMQFNDGASVLKHRFIQSRIEAEIAFVLKMPLGGADVTRDDVMKATDCVAPSTAVLDTRIISVDTTSGQTRTVFSTPSPTMRPTLALCCGSSAMPLIRLLGAITSRNDEVEEAGLSCQRRRAGQSARPKRFSAVYITEANTDMNRRWS